MRLLAELSLKPRIATQSATDAYERRVSASGSLSVRSTTGRVTCLASFFLALVLLPSHPLSDRSGDPRALRSAHPYTRARDHT